MKAGAGFAGPFPGPQNLYSPSSDTSGFGWDERSGRSGNVKTQSPRLTHPKHNREPVPEMGTSQGHMG